jgi:monovalent cation:H+ antiporter-2, CPA2 family
VPNELVALGASFVAAGLLARLGRGVGLPTIPFFMVAGILTGPHTPGLVLFRDPEDLQLFASVGLIALLFHLGLEFSLDDLRRGGRRLLTAGAIYLLLSVGGGLVLGLALGWGAREALVIAGAIGISSSAIVTKLLIELHRLANRETPLILGITVAQDVFLALYLAALQPVLGRASGLPQVAAEFGRAVAFLVVLFAIARYAARWVGHLVGASDDELLTVMFLGVAILVAGVAEELGVSAAMGALLVGLILARTSVAERIHRLVLPIRDAFGAVFFFAFGLTIDPRTAGGVLRPVAIAVVVTAVLSVAAGAAAARIYRFDRRSALAIAFTLLGRGEFSLILATLAAGAGLDERVMPFIALYVLTLAILGPILASRPGVGRRPAMAPRH